MTRHSIARHGLAPHTPAGSGSCVTFVFVCVCVRAIRRQNPTNQAIHFKPGNIAVIARGRYDHIFCQRLHADLEAFSVMAVEVNADRAGSVPSV